MLFLLSLLFRQLTDNCSGLIYTSVWLTFVALTGREPVTSEQFLRLLLLLAVSLSVFLQFVLVFIFIYAPEVALNCWSGVFLNFPSTAFHFSFALVPFILPRISWLLSLWPLWHRLCLSPDGRLCDEFYDFNCLNCPLSLSFLTLQAVLGSLINYQSTLWLAN